MTRNINHRTFQSASWPGARLLAAASLAILAALAHAAELPSPEPDSPVARIDGKPLTYAALDERVHDALAKQRREYATQLRRLELSSMRAESRERESALNKLVDERVLALEAAARRISTEQLLEAVQAPAPTDAEMHALYDAQRSRVGQSFDTLRPQIEEFLRGEATEQARQRYLQSLRDKYHVVMTWDPLREQVDATGPHRGPDGARVTIVEFSDFQCPYCGELAPILKQLLAAYPNDLRLVFRNLPLRTLHPNAARAARAGVCADAQGKFWEMHDAMYGNQNALGATGLQATAAELNLDPRAFADCLAAAELPPSIVADEAAADRLGLSGTPSSFVNGRFVSGALSFDKWRVLIDDELRRATAKSRDSKT
jgi:protein-disulfide isomerase